MAKTATKKMVERFTVQASELFFPKGKDKKKPKPKK